MWSWIYIFLAVGFSLQIYAADLEPIAIEPAASATNQWEKQADETNSAVAVKLYAVAITNYSIAAKPDIAGVIRCLDKFPWQEVDAAEFKAMAREMEPLLSADNQKFAEWQKRLVTKYRLLQDDDEPDIALNKLGYVIPRIDIPEIDIPENAIVLVRIDDGAFNEIETWSAVYELAFRVMGRDGLYVPHHNSPLGWRRTYLVRKLEAAGPGWRTDPDLLAEWEEYWVYIRAGLDRRERMQGQRTRILTR